MRLYQPAAFFAAALAALSGVPAAAQFTRRHGALRALAVADGDADAVVASRQLEEDVVVIDLAAEDDAASLSMSMGAATEFFMAAKAGKPPAAKAAKPPATPAPTTSKAAKADDETAAKSEKSGKSDLSFSMSLSSKSGKSKSAKTQAPTPCVNPEVPSAKASKGKSAKSDGSYSFSYGLDGSSKSGKADGLSFSLSLPSKSGKSKPGDEGAAKSAKGAGTKASKSIILPCLTDAPTDSPTSSPTDSPTKNPTQDEMAELNAAVSSFNYTNVEDIKGAFDALGYTLIATPTYDALAEDLSGVYGGITGLGQFDIDEFDCIGGSIEPTVGFDSDLDSHPYMLFAGFGPGGFLGTAAQIYSNYSSETELKDLFSPNEERELYAYVLNANGTEVVDDSGTTSTIFSDNVNAGGGNGHQPGPNGYYQTDQFSNDDGIWGFSIGRYVNGNSGTGDYLREDPTVSYGVENDNGGDGQSQFYWGERIDSQEYAFYFAVKKTSECAGRPSQSPSSSTQPTSSTVPSLQPSTSAQPTPVNPNPIIVNPSDGGGDARCVADNEGDLCLQAVTQVECPAQPDIQNCFSVLTAIGELCEGDGECGTSNSLELCAEAGGSQVWDVYRRIPCTNPINVSGPDPIAPIGSIVEPKPLPPIDTYEMSNEICPNLLKERCLAASNSCKWTGEECSPCEKCFDSRDENVSE